MPLSSVSRPALYTGAVPQLPSPHHADGV